MLMFYEVVLNALLKILRPNFEKRLKLNKCNLILVKVSSIKWVDAFGKLSLSVIGVLCHDDS